MQVNKSMTVSAPQFPQLFDRRAIHIKVDR
jgi:hypothetical protein